ncbi:MAG TPA: hypothetical protein VKZ60_18840 [Chloroflexota bacterium]|nr:hypothetical protein [Chloroflexota bacterium]
MDAVPLVRARIGLIIPSSNRLTEPQFRQHAPPGVAVHVTRLRMTGPHHVPLAALRPRLAEAALALADARCDLIVFHCTAGSMEEGPAGERAILDAITEATGRPAATTATAVLAALAALGARRLVLLSPYAPAAHAAEVAFLTAAGHAVVRDRALALGGSDAYIAAPPRLWLESALALADPRADAYFLSCTNIHALPAIVPLEAALGRPVVASNQATLWYCLRRCGLADTVPGLGTLLERALPAPVAI